MLLGNGAHTIIKDNKSNLNNATSYTPVLKMVYTFKVVIGKLHQPHLAIVSYTSVSNVFFIFVKMAYIFLNYSILDGEEYQEDHNIILN